MKKRKNKCKNEADLFRKKFQNHFLRQDEMDSVAESVEYWSSEPVGSIPDDT